MNAYNIISSASHALTATPYTFSGASVVDPNPLNDPKSRLIRVYGDVDFSRSHGWQRRDG
jgi:hypothetical protein